MPVGALAPNWSDLDNLYELIRKLKPLHVLEIGGGCSTIISLIALSENAEENSDLATAVLYSIDESKYWLDSTSSYVPDDMRQLLKQKLVTPKLIDIGGTTVSVVDELPEKEFDFLYIDGGLVSGNSIGADALFVEKNASEKFTILVDGRQRTVDYLQNNLKRNYEMTTNLTHSWTVFHPI